MLANLIPVASLGTGVLWLGLALWLRLGLYPFIEANVHARWQDYGGLVYLSLSLTVGIYLLTRVVAAPLVGFLPWLVIIFMLLNGLLAWLSDERPNLLARLLLVEAALVLLVAF